MQTKVNYNALIRNSFYCGVILQFITSLGIFSEMALLSMVTGIFLAGFVYSLLLVEGEFKNLKNFVFVILGGGLHILATYVTGNQNEALNFALASSLSAPVYFLFYCILIDDRYNILKGLLFSFLAGLISAAFPVISISFSLERTLAIFLLFTVFPIWQTLFAVALKLSAKPNNQNIIQPSSVTSA